MSECSVEEFVPAPAERVWELLRHTETWPDRVSAVRSVVRHSSSEAVVRSEWEVEISRAVLWWQGEERYDDAARQMTFTAIEGDLAELDGVWRVTGIDRRQSLLQLSIRFEVGIPALAARIDPIAEQALGRAMRELVKSMSAALEGDLS